MNQDYQNNNNNTFGNVDNNVVENVNNNSQNTNYQTETTKPKKGKTGLIVAIVVVIILALICFTMFKVFNHVKSAFNNLTTITDSDADATLTTFYADGYELKYNLRWRKTKLYNNTSEVDALVYGNKELYLMPVGISALSSFESEKNTDFSTVTGKMSLYNEFYNYWNKGSVVLNGGSSTFTLLVDNIYYAYMNYSSSSNNSSGKLYIIVNEEKNVVISMMSIISNDLVDDNYQVTKVLKTINIEKTYDNEMANYLDNLSAWNMYSSLRMGTLGTKKDINGGWRILSDSETYWVFKNGEFWWYKSRFDTNDNYWYGTTKVLVGKEGLKEVGLSEDKVDKIVANSSGKVSSDSIYTIIFTPSKIILDGVDKSATNITGEDWHMVWIIVDHGSEGLEAQVLNVKTADTAYYVKVVD